jgi:outer membrane immunogenic protein
MSMKSKFGAIAAAAVLAVSATAASAQGLSPWTGFYIGGNVGYAWSNDTDPSIKGFAGGLHGGYNFQFNQIVAGIEGDYSFSNADASVTVAGVTATAEIDSIWSVRGRLGFLAAPNALIYGTLGYGGAKFSGRETMGGLTTFSMSANARGLVLGGGLEYAFTRNILGRVEALHLIGKGTGDIDGLDVDVTQIRAGLSYRF